MLKRNPFKYIGKVYKYECKNISRTLVPLFAILIVMGLVLGLLQSPMSSYTKNIADNEAQIQSSSEGNLFNYEATVMLENNKAMKAVAVFFLGLIFAMYVVAVFIVTMVILSGRFKKSMLGDEAYLNLVLPVTMGEHIWGRFLAALTWVILCFVTTGISCCLLMIRNEATKWIPELIEGVRKTGFEAIGMSPASFFTQQILMMFIIVITIILLIYCVNSLGHLSQNNKTIIKFAATICLFYLMINLPGWIIGALGEDVKMQTKMLVTMLSYLALCAGFMTTTQLVFSKKLNLE